MGGIIDFDTSCPWEVYLFALLNLLGGLAMCFFDACKLLTSAAACTDAEKVMQTLIAISMIYVGVVFGVVNYHNKDSAGKVTRLSNVTLSAATALLVCVVFTGNASYGGLERSWMHLGDMLTMIVVVVALSHRVMRTDAEWAQKNDMTDDLGINCKTLLVFFMIATGIKFIAYTDFVDPANLLAKGSEMTDFAQWCWYFTSVCIFNVFLAIFYSVFFDDEAGHELLVITIAVMSAVSMAMIYPAQKNTSNWMGINSNTMWVKLAIVIFEYEDDLKCKSSIGAQIVAMGDGEGGGEGRVKRGTAFARPSTDNGEVEEKRRARGTVIDPNVLSHDGEGEGKRRARGTVIGPFVLVKGASGKALPGVYLDESGEPVSTAAKVPDRVKFPSRKSVIQQICLEEVAAEVPASNAGPKKTSLKAFNQGSLCVDKGELQRSNSRDIQQTEEAVGKLLAEYGLSEVMVKRLLHLCANTRQMKVLLENGPLMKREDGKCIEGKRKDAEWIQLEEKRLAESNTEEYDLSVAPCARFVELQDICFFLINLAATMAMPTTFELFAHPRKIGGVGKGVRKIRARQDASNMSSAEDYIPIGEQVESALEMIESFEECIDTASCANTDKLFADVKKMCGDECLEKQDKKILVVAITSLYPWGRRGGDRDLPELRAKFVDMINEFADLPVTFVFLVQSREKNIVDFYDRLTAPETGIRADVKVAKGLGLMIDGVAKHNPWLNFCLPMHLCQTLGIGSNVLSQAASRPLSASEVRDVCNTLIGDVPDPALDVDTFLSAVEALMASDEARKWNPAVGTDTALIDVAKLKKHLNPSRLFGILAAIVVCILAVIVGKLTGRISFRD
ncbi:hypothetical protein ACHAXT_004084 [Thalassiosira profunda]